MTLLRKRGSSICGEATSNCPTSDLGRGFAAAFAKGLASGFSRDFARDFTSGFAGGFVGDFVMPSESSFGLSHNSKIKAGCPVVVFWGLSVVSRGLPLDLGRGGGYSHCMRLAYLTNIYKTFFAGMAIAIVLCLSPVYAATGGWHGDKDIARLRLIATTLATGDEAVIRAGLEVELGEGWKIYWRSPGDAGLPPVLDFSQTSNIQQHAMQFPAPHRFSLFGLDTFGYSERVIFPLTLTVIDANKPLLAVADFSGLVCREVCIPLSYQLDLSLPRGDASPSRHAYDIAQAQAQVPSLGTSRGVRVVEAVVRGDTLSLRLADRDGTAVGLSRYGNGGNGRGVSDVLVEADDGFAFSAPDFVNGAAVVTISGKPPAGLIGKQAIATVLTPEYMLEEAITITSAAASSGAIHASYAPLSSLYSMGGGLLIAIIGGLLGGVLLNGMPCVLPVLAVKLTSVVGLGGAAQKTIRRRFLMTAFGIVASFIVLGLVLLALRAGGAAIGWGVQFQNPLFLIALIVVMLGFALVLADFWLVPIPSFANRLASASGGLGGDMKDMAGGALAVLLATPCSAPFLGVAVAFAFVATPSEMLAVFVAMGMGLALPWLVIAAKPKWVAALPKPGAWLVGMKRLLAVGLLMTALWLGLVLTSVVGDGRGGDGDWETWLPDKAEMLVAEGQVVLVDVTADWCLTCKANKLFVLNSEATETVIKQVGAVKLKADWTKRNDSILAYLSSFDRYGIPFNIVYGPGAQQGIILPEVLTHASLADALKRARGL